MITLTEKAVAKVRGLMAEKGGTVTIIALRISVSPGGCSGFEYFLELVENFPAEDDAIFESFEVKIFVDKWSLQYLEGLTIDYSDSINETGFRFINPNATGGCGCGTSFSV